MIKVNDLGTLNITVRITKRAYWRVRLCLLLIQLASWVYPGSMPLIYEETQDA